jgi:RimJ/RimL family protein N-acetyltransferase
MTLRTNIQPVTNPDQIQAIVELADEIWTEHYTLIIGEGQVAYMLEKFQSNAAISGQIKDGTLYYLILFDTKPAGYISVYKKNNSLFLSKFYVKKSLRGMGIGKTAMAFIDAIALELECDSISLTVNKNNTNSIKAYEKLGFVNQGPLVIDIGGGYIMDDFAFEKPMHKSK